MPQSAVLTDIEGTTTDIAFVHKVLFPYARERFAAYLCAHAAESEVRAVLAEIGEIEGRPQLTPQDAVSVLTKWSDEDRKIKPLKTLQGLIWTEGYEAGVLKAHVYPDVAPALRRWHESGIGLYVYSSGSVAAQKLLFAHTPEGDLTPLFAGYFDTATGSKLEAESYRKIAAAILHPAHSILFLSDSEKELAAAAGMRAVQFDRTRPLDRPPSLDGLFPVVSGFHQIEPESATGVGDGKPQTKTTAA